MARTKVTAKGMLLPIPKRIRCDDAAATATAPPTAAPADDAAPPTAAPTVDAAATAAAPTADAAATAAAPTADVRNKLCKTGLGVLALLYLESERDASKSFKETDLDAPTRCQLSSLIWNARAQMRSPDRKARKRIMRALATPETAVVTQLRRLPVLTALFDALDKSEDVKSKAVSSAWHKLRSERQWLLFHATEALSPLDQHFGPQWEK